MALAAKVLVCNISNYGDVSIPPFALLQNMAVCNSSVLSSHNRVTLGKKSAVYSDQGLR